MAQNCGPVRYRENGDHYRLSPPGNKFVMCCDCEYYQECMEESSIHELDVEEMA